MTRYKPRWMERADAGREAMDKTEKRYAAWGDRRIGAFLAFEYPAMKELYDAGRLPEQELLALIRASFFAPFGADKFDRITAKDVTHRPLCAHNDARIKYSSSSSEITSITSNEGRIIWLGMLGAADAVPKKMFGQEHAGATCTIDLRVHQATCPCGAHVSRLSAHVTITFAGRTVARELALAPPVPS
jgi:hypothetical protein